MEQSFEKTFQVLNKLCAVYGSICILVDFIYRFGHKSNAYSSGVDLYGYGSLSLKKRAVGVWAEVYCKFKGEK